MKSKAEIVLTVGFFAVVAAIGTWAALQPGPPGPPEPAFSDFTRMSIQQGYGIYATIPDLPNMVEVLNAEEVETTAGPGRRLVGELRDGWPVLRSSPDQQFTYRSRPISFSEHRGKWVLAYVYHQHNVETGFLDAVRNATDGVPNFEIWLVRLSRDRLHSTPSRQVGFDRLWSDCSARRARNRGRSCFDRLVYGALPINGQLFVNQRAWLATVMEPWRAIYDASTSIEVLLPQAVLIAPDGTYVVLEDNTHTAPVHQISLAMESRGMAPLALPRWDDGSVRHAWVARHRAVFREDGMDRFEADLEAWGRSLGRTLRDMGSDDGFAGTEFLKALPLREEDRWTADQVRDVFERASTTIQRVAKERERSGG